MFPVACIQASPVASASSPSYDFTTDAAVISKTTPPDQATFSITGIDSGDISSVLWEYRKAAEAFAPLLNDQDVEFSPLFRASDYNVEVYDIQVTVTPNEGDPFLIGPKTGFITVTA